MRTILLGSSPWLYLWWALVFLACVACILLFGAVVDRVIALFRHLHDGPPPRAAGLTRDRHHLDSVIQITERQR